MIVFLINHHVIGTYIVGTFLQAANVSFVVKLIPYSWKFLRELNFTVFVDFAQLEN